MGDIQKILLCAAASALIFGAGYWMGERADIHDNGAGIDGAGDHISAAQDAATAAGTANQDAQDTADRLGESNQTIADLIAEGESILAGIRGRGEEDT